MRYLIISAFFLLSFCIASIACGQRKASLPHIIWISFEELSGVTFRPGDSIIKTPTLNRVVKQSLWFENAYAMAAAAIPSQAGIQSGLYPTTFGAMHQSSGNGAENAVLPGKHHWLAEEMRMKGYFTLQFGQHSLKLPPSIWQMSYNDSRFSTDTLSYQLKRIAAKTPVFLHIRLAAPTNEALGKYAVSDKVRLPHYFADNAEAKQEWQNAYRRAAFADEQLGKIWEILEKQQGLLSKSYVFVFGENGFRCSCAPQLLYEENIRVPLLVHTPDGKAAHVKKMVSLTDLMPTTLAVAKVNTDLSFPGLHLINSGQTHKVIAAASDRINEHPDRIRAVRSGSLKYIRNFRKDLPFIPYHLLQENCSHRLLAEATPNSSIVLLTKSIKPAEELYDLSKDLWEQQNLANHPDYQNDLQRMRNYCDHWVNSTGDLGGLTEAAMRAMLWESTKQPVSQEPHFTKTKDNKISICSPTEGAAILYRLDWENEWHYYTRPITLQPGMTISAKSVKHGLRESKEITVKFSSDR